MVEICKEIFRVYILSCFLSTTCPHTCLIYRHEIARVPGNFGPDEVVSQPAVLCNISGLAINKGAFIPAVNLTIPLQIIVIIFYDSTPQYYINILGHKLLLYKTSLHFIFFSFLENYFYFSLTLPTWNTFIANRNTSRKEKFKIFSLCAAIIARVPSSMINILEVERLYWQKRVYKEFYILYNLQRKRKCR